MNNSIPPKVRDLSDSKQRVMSKVINEIQSSSKRTKHPWRFAVIATILTMCALIFVLSEVTLKEKPAATEPVVDLTKPLFFEEQGFLYLYGITLGDSEAKVKEQFGEDFTIVEEEDRVADFIMDYKGQARFYFKEDRLDSIVFMNVNEDYFDKLFKEYEGFKFIFHWYLDNDNRLFYSKETSQILHASTMSSDGNTILSLSYAGPNHWEENAEFLYMTEQNLNTQHLPPTNLNIDLTKPTIIEEQGYLYLHGITYGDSPSKVIEQLGTNYIIGQTDVGEYDYILDYDGRATFYFYKGKIESITLKKVDKKYFDELFKDYDGLKLIDSTRDVDSDRYLYSKDTGMLLKATTHTPNEDLYLYLIPSGKDLLENPDFPGVEVTN